MVKKEDFFKNSFIIKREGSAEFLIHTADYNLIPSKSMKVFYNKKMEINRDITNLAIMTFKTLYHQNNLIIVDTMAASGIGSIRMIKECKDIKKIYINDINPAAIELIRDNLKLNKIEGDNSEIIITQKDANLLNSEIAQSTFVHSRDTQERPNVISIDPFGTPNLYIDSAFKAIQKISGLMCITATDTAVLFGIRSLACIRKYMSKPLHTEYCKEIGARILIYFISRIANINKLGIIPLLTFYSNHFIRVFALTIKNKKKISNYFKNYGYIIHCNSCGYRSKYQNMLSIPKKCPKCKDNSKLNYAGPLWVEKIHESTFIKKILDLNKVLNYSNKNKIDKLLNFALDEINMPISYFNIHKLSQKLKLQTVPKMEMILNLIEEKGYKASRTHFDFTSIKTDMNLEMLENLFLEKFL